MEKEGVKESNRKCKDRVTSRQKEVKSRYLSGNSFKWWMRSLFIVVIDLGLQILCQSGKAALAADFSFVLRIGW